MPDCETFNWPDIGFGKCLVHDEVFLLPDGECRQRRKVESPTEPVYGVEELREQIWRLISRAELSLDVDRLYTATSIRNLGRIDAFKAVLSLLPKEATHVLPTA